MTIFEWLSIASPVSINENIDFQLVARSRPRSSRNSTDGENHMPRSISVFFVAVVFENNLVAVVGASLDVNDELAVDIFETAASPVCSDRHHHRTSHTVV